MEAENQKSSQANRFQMDDVRMTHIVEWNKKRKLQIDQLDMLRPKHKCWVRSFPSEEASILDENLRSERMHDLPVNGKPGALVHDDRPSPVSAEDSNSFAEDSDASMSVYEEVRLEADSAKTFLYGRPSNSFVNWNGYNVKDVTSIEKTISSEEDIFTDREYNQSYHEADIQALQNLEEQIVGCEKLKDDLYSEHAKDNCEESMDKGFEDLLYSSGVNPNVYVLSSGRWEVNQEAQSSTRPPTIDQEFEEYFSMLML
ncbi:protein FAR-RED-ELONGATED HYPOCOTYL 1-LIKE isoform X2 [Neltuma alba]|uniref:protein FAR-RED-ELONGATED HYPOCOTYL 1-LIKE isoform X2 n=1 Tax=Neltuma alba TaxID=207710 RepID=UPI0010A2BD3E|nr:protein FAR-RED-ELONGATED HYPOCOTYL 1-LIKE-like isoform X2 [Prosopis alba]